MSIGITDRGNQSAKAQRQEITILHVWWFLYGWAIENKAQFSRMGQEEVPVDHTKGFYLESQWRGAFSCAFRDLLCLKFTGFYLRQGEGFIWIGVMKLWQDCKGELMREWTKIVNVDYIRNLIQEIFRKWNLSDSLNNCYVKEERMRKYESIILSSNVGERYRFQN